MVKYKKTAYEYFPCLNTIHEPSQIDMLYLPFSPFQQGLQEFQGCVPLFPLLPGVRLLYTGKPLLHHFLKVPYWHLPVGTVLLKKLNNIPVNL
jgi:hypothetical protein